MMKNTRVILTRAVVPLLNAGARVPVCGFVSNYNAVDMSKVESPLDILKQLDSVPEHRFFVVTEWRDRWVEATRLLGNWVSEGKLKYKESIGTGLENPPQLFRGLLKGKNFGKQLVKVAGEE